MAKIGLRGWQAKRRLVAFEDADGDSVDGDKRLRALRAANVVRDTRKHAPAVEVDRAVEHLVSQTLKAQAGVLPSDLSWL